MSTPTGNTVTRGSDVRGLPLQAAAGTPVYASLEDVCDDFNNAAGDAHQIDSITVSFADAATYTITVGDVGGSVTLVETDEGDANSVALALRRLLRAEPLIGELVEVTGATDQIVLTGRFPNFSYPVTLAGGQLAFGAQTSAAGAAEIAPGEIAIQTAMSSNGTRKGARAAAGRFVAQVDAWTFVFQANATVYFEVVVDEQVYQGSASMGAVDLPTAITAIANAMDAVLPAATVDAADDGAAIVTLTAEQAGRPFTSRVWFGTNQGGASAAKVSNAATALTSLPAALLGAALYSTRIEAQAIGNDTAVYTDGDMVPYMHKGVIWVAVDSAPVAGGAVWIGLGAGEEGQSFPTAAATRVRLPTSQAVFERPGDADRGAGFAALSLRP